MKEIKKLQKESFFHDTKGNIVLWQWPNIPIYGWVASKLLSMIVPVGHIRFGFEQLSLAFLFTWAFLEIIKGVNYFRRLLGAIVIVAIIIGYFNK